MLIYTLTYRPYFHLDPATRPANIISQLQALRRDVVDMVDAWNPGPLRGRNRADTDWKLERSPVAGREYDVVEISIPITFSFDDTDPASINNEIESLKKRIHKLFAQFYSGQDFVVTFADAWDDVVLHEGEPTTLHRMKNIRGQGRVHSGLV